MEFINPPELNDPTSYGFTNIVTVPPGTKLVYVAGQGSGTTDDGGYPESFAEQVDRAFANLRKALTAIGASPATVVKITVLSVDHTDEKLRVISAARRAFWPDKKPASTLIPVP
ncbi:MAG: RidA family protein, partial [Cyanobacteria bacterium J06636_16]